MTERLWDLGTAGKVLVALGAAVALLLVTVALFPSRTADQPPPHPAPTRASSPVLGSPASAASASAALKETFESSDLRIGEARWRGRTWRGRPGRASAGR